MSSYRSASVVSSQSNASAGPHEVGNRDVLHAEGGDGVEGDSGKEEATLFLAEDAPNLAEAHGLGLQVKKRPEPLLHLAGLGGGFHGFDGRERKRLIERQCVRSNGSSKRSALAQDQFADFSVHANSRKASDVVGEQQGRIGEGAADDGARTVNKERKASGWQVSFRDGSHLVASMHAETHKMQ